jgi:5-methylcytosine-specific restriction enzyme A
MVLRSISVRARGNRFLSIANGKIEAHHLQPIASLEEGVPIKYDVASDFAVLCANCHRMIHRTPDPSDLAAFKAMIMSELGGILVGS